jgi:hypothetical protein
MRSLARVVVLAGLLTGVVVSPVFAVTPQDLVKLHIAGLSDDILIALIASDGSTFKLTADEIIGLRNQGLSERVLHAMLMAGKEVPVQAAAAARDRVPAGALVLYDLSQAIAAADPAPAPVVNVTQTQTVEQRVEQPRVETQTVYVPVHVGFPVVARPHEPEKKPEPVYWGFGGQRRPDTWKDRDK